MDRLSNNFNGLGDFSEFIFGFKNYLYPQILTTYPSEKTFHLLFTDSVSLFTYTNIRKFKSIEKGGME